MMPSSSAVVPPKKRKGGRTVKFEANEAMRGLVKMILGMGVCKSYDEICEVLINPHTNQPISRDTFERTFKREIKTAQLEVKVIWAQSMVGQMKKGAPFALAMFAKNKLDWSDNPVAERSANSKVDPAGHTVRHVVEYRGGLPKGSTPENPQGEAPDIPPEEPN